MSSRRGKYGLQLVRRRLLFAHVGLTPQQHLLCLYIAVAADSIDLLNMVFLILLGSIPKVTGFVLRCAGSFLSFPLAVFQVNFLFQCLAYFFVNIMAWSVNDCLGPTHISWYNSHVVQPFSRYTLSSVLRDYCQRTFALVAVFVVWAVHGVLSGIFFCVDTSAVYHTWYNDRFC